MGWRQHVQDVLRKRGYEFVRFPLMRYLAQQRINVVLDVGGNRGQYGVELRRLGYQGRIVSFEPLSVAFAQLQDASANDASWEIHQIALGREAGEAKLNIAGNLASSSFKAMLPRHETVAPTTAYTGTEQVPIARLDALFSDFCQPQDRVFLKIDTQGFEQEVLDGAAGVIDRIAGLQLELSLVPLYEGQPMAETLIAQVRTLGFTPYWINHGFKDPETQQLLQMEGLFFRSDS